MNTLKSKINPKHKPEIKFPCLMQSKKSKQVVLFINKTQAIRLNQGNISEEVLLGYLEESLYSSEDDDIWEVFEDQIILENQL